MTASVSLSGALTRMGATVCIAPPATPFVHAGWCHCVHGSRGIRTRRDNCAYEPLLSCPDVVHLPVGLLRGFR